MITLTNYSMIDSTLDVVKKEACLQFDKGKTLHIDWYYTDKTAITTAQNKALHLWFDQCAKVLNDNGHLCSWIHPISKTEIELPWTKELFKEFIYKRTLATFKEISSTQSQDTDTINDVTEAIAMAYSKYCRVVLPFFPSKETITSGLTIGNNN